MRRSNDVLSRRLREAIMMADTGDERSFNEIYGEEGIPLEGDDAVGPESLGPEQIAQLRDLANQILAIVGTGAPAANEGDGAMAGDSLGDVM